MNDTSHKHAPSYKLDITIWVVLIALTALTIFASYATMGTTVLAVSIAMLIATIKAGTVITYYMHIKWDHFIYKIFLFVIAALFISFIGLMIIDYAYR